MPTNRALTIVPAPTLKPAERTIMANLGHTPWSACQLTDPAVTDARGVWGDLREAVGFNTRNGGWVTTSITNPKMRKNGLPTIGVTLHSALRAREVWAEVPLDRRLDIAAALQATINEIEDVLRFTVCPFATKGCTGPCVTSESHHSQFEAASLTRLNRTLLSLLRPADAFTLTGHALTKLHAANGTDCRWRVNVSDDIRWELVAPGLFDLGVPAYAYTKFSPADRPGRNGFSVVYSATERTTEDEIAARVAAGHRVAVVFDVPRKKLPTTWRGLKVVDGDTTDDLFAHPAGVVVGLAAKARNREILQGMRESGFARAA